jgi:ribonuclease D
LEIVTTDSQLEEAVETALREPQVALDTEGNSFFRYPEQLCLVQLATPTRVWVVDPLAVSDMSPLARLLANKHATILAHGADYDVRSLDREWGYHIHRLYDTTIAARFVGIEHFGLGALAEDLLGIVLPKDKRLQRADWSLRPLGKEALEYAAGDVRHLMTLREILDQKIETLGRATWVAEECQRIADVRFVPPDLETTFLSVKGSGVLDPKALAIFKELFTFRDEEARRRGVPPFRVLPDSALLYLAAHPQDELADAPGLNESGIQRYGRGLRESVIAGTGKPPVYRPKMATGRPMPEVANRLKRLKQWRAQEAARLELDQSLVWSAVSLERLSRAPGEVQAAMDAPEVRRWQRAEFEMSLRACLAELLQA